jgi:hypothetical protein
VTMRFAEEAVAIGSLAGEKDVPYTHADAEAAIAASIDICLPPPRPEPEPSDEPGEVPDLPDVPPEG